MSDFIILDTQSEEKESVVTSNFSIAALDAWLLSKQGIKMEQKVIFFRLLATMTNAGLSLMKSVNILEKQEKNPIMKKIYSNIIAGIK